VRRLAPICSPVATAILAAVAMMFLAVGTVRAADPVLPDFVGAGPAGDLVPGATGYGPIQEDIPVAPVLRGEETIGWAFVTSDFVPTTGYSGKPIHILMALDKDARIIGVKLVKHSEPIVLIGIPNAKIEAATRSMIGVDLRQEGRGKGGKRKLDIISGATVTVMVIDDSIIRAGVKVAHALGLGGFEKAVEPDANSDIPRMSVDDPGDVRSWTSLIGDGSVRSLRLTNADVNTAFDALGDARARARPQSGDPADAFAEIHVALASQPTIGRSLLGDAEYETVKSWLGEGDEAVFIAGGGGYSYKGSGYVRGGIFDRFQLIQGDQSVRFTDKMYRRIGAVAAAGAPPLTEADIFKVPAGSGFNPAEPFRIELLVQRAVGPIEKLFTTFDLGYQLPSEFLTRPVVSDSAPGMTHLWKEIWSLKRVEVGFLLLAIGVLTAAFFFQMELTRNEKVTYWFRIGFLTFTLFFIGWFANAQLSVVNIFAFANAMMNDFSWSAFLMDPLIFILWFSVAASLLFWGRGAYCGWLCPFGALQELTNKVGRLFKIPQIRVPWSIHERLWPLKYMIFLGLFGLSLYSLELAERFSEIEPFKTAIILKFARGWPFVLFAVALLVAGLFIERFYCRYLCPLGAALAIPGRIRMFDWLRRYRECGNPCQRCANECFIQAIHPEGHINPNECHQCLHCQVLYQSKTKCPVCIKKDLRLQRLREKGGDDAVELAAARPDPHRRLAK
jgi:NosR/NirI family nitrous oxide reductase transcriptional regulator